MIKEGIAALAVALGLFWQSAVCSAEIVEGAAPIIDGNITEARENARLDAMRNYVERAVGVIVDSHSEIDMGVLVSDEIVTDSRGYVQIKNIVSEGARGQVYYIKMDLEANEYNIELKYKDDVKKAMECMSDTYDSRKVADIAVAGFDMYGRAEKDESATAIMGQYMMGMGVVPTFNESVMDYLVRTEQPTVSNVRRLARTSRTEANSVLGGRIKELNVSKVDGGYMAEVEAYFLFIGLNNNLMNTYDEYFYAFGKTQNEAIKKARKQAATAAAEALVRSSLKVMQIETRGGVRRF